MQPLPAQTFRRIRLRGLRVKRLVHPIFLAFVLLFSRVVASAGADRPFPAPTLSLSSTNPTCGKSNGSIVARVTGGTAPYSYQLNGGPPQTSNVFPRLGPGTHTLTVTDATNQTATATVLLTNQFTPPTDVTAQWTLPTGCTSQDATMTLTGTGGTPPYTFSIDRTNFQASNVFTNLSAGSYYTAVKDANGCLNPFIWWNTTNIPERCLMTQRGQNRSYLCGPFQSFLGLEGIDGGTPPYQYSLDGVTFQTNKDFFPLPGGLYTITVKDGTGALTKYTVALYDACDPLLSIVTKAQPSNCSTSNGSVSVSATEGTSPYQYSIDGVNFQSTGQFNGLTAGTYTVVVKDANNLTESKLVIVPASCLQISANTTQSTCGKANGTIQVNVFNGAVPYQYSLNGSSFQSSASFTGVAPGRHIITVKDATGLTVTYPVTVTDQPGPALTSLATTPTGCTAQSGSLTVNAQSGTPPLQYSLNNGTYQTANLFSNLGAGNYRVTVKDANGCLATDTASVVLNNDLRVNAGNDVTICEGGNQTLSAASNATSFSWSPAAGLTNPALLQPQASPAVTTRYVLTATTGPCSRKDSVTVAVIPSPVPDAGRDTTICLGNSLVLNGTGGISYTWSPAAQLSNPSSATPTFTPTAKGRFVYSLRATDANGCASLLTSTVAITVISPVVDAGRDTVILSGQPFQLMAADPGNAGFTTYSWSPTYGLSSPVVKNPVANVDRDIVYTVTATTGNGCTATDAVTVKVYKGVDIYVPSGFTPNGDGRNDLLKAIPVGIREFRGFSVFNRWGQLVFQTRESAKGWNGQLNGMLQEGVFLWIAEGVDYSGNLVRRKGTVMLIR